MFASLLVGSNQSLRREALASEGGQRSVDQFDVKPSEESKSVRGTAGERICFQCYRCVLAGFEIKGGTIGDATKELEWRK